MNTQESTLISTDLLAELQEAAENAAKGVRDSAKAMLARQRMDRIREENRLLFGEQSCAVELIRQTREQT